MNNLKPPGRDEHIIRALLIERRNQADIARELGISRARLGQILERLGIHTRPVRIVDNPERIRALVPEWTWGNDDLPEKLMEQHRQQVAGAYGETGEK